MDQFEKVEKIAQKANVSFEEAKAALEANNWDMLDAMIALENRGRSASAQNQQAFKTGFDNQPGYRKVDTADAGTYKRSKYDFSDKIKQFFIKSHVNHFVARRKGDVIIDMPIWAAVLIICCFWKVSLALLLIGLFCGCSFSFEGPKDFSSVNKAMNNVEKTAESIKESFNSSFKSAMNDNDRSNVSNPTQEEHVEYHVNAAKPEEPKQTAAAFEQNDFNPILDSEITNAFTDNSVTTEDGKITLEL